MQWLLICIKQKVVMTLGLAGNLRVVTYYSLKIIFGKLNMKKMSKLIFFFFLGVLATGCAKVDDDIPSSQNSDCAAATGTSTYSYSADIQPIFNNNCSCHTGSSPSGSLDLSDGNSYTNLYEIASGRYSPDVRVYPGSPAQSVLYGKVANIGGWGGEMPPSRSLSASEIEIIKTWICEGATNN